MSKEVQGQKVNTTRDYYRPIPPGSGPAERYTTDYICYQICVLLSRSKMRIIGD